MKAVALAALFAAGLLLAHGLAARDAAAQATTVTTPTTVRETTTHTVRETTTSTVRETTTAPGTTVVTTSTVAPTTPTTTTTTSPTKSSTPTWVWVALAILAAAVVGLAVALVMRRGGAIPPAERHRRLDNAVATWAAQGWALESQTPDSAILARGGEQMVVSVDEAGNVSAHPLPRRDAPS
jgi:cytoskeletal protein RodZ